MTQEQIKEAREFVMSLPLVMARAGELGLFKTQHALHEAVQTSGYELSDNIENSMHEWVVKNWLPEVLEVKPMEIMEINDQTFTFKWLIGLPASRVYYNEDLGKRMPTAEVEAWCDAQCSGKWKSLAVGPVERTRDVYLYFELQRDAVLFKVFWPD